MRFAAFYDHRMSMVRFLRTATLGVVLSLLATAGQAEADCGDWLAPLDAVETTATVLDQVKPSPQVPCHGPSCRDSRQPLPAVPFAPSRQFDQPDRWCGVIDEPRELPPHIGTLDRETTPAMPDGHRPSIDRPPCV